MNLFKTKMTAMDDSRVTTCERKCVAWNAGLDYWTEDQKKQQSKRGVQVMSSIEQRKIKADLFRKTIKEMDSKSKEWRQRGSKNRKPVMTPYGKFNSALEAGRILGPQLGLKPNTIQSYIMRSSEKYANWHYVKDAK